MNTPDDARVAAAVATLEALGFGVRGDGATLWTIIDTSGDRVYAWAFGVDELEALAERVKEES